MSLITVTATFIYSILSTVYSYVLFVQKEGCYIIAHKARWVTPSGQCDFM